MPANADQDEVSPKFVLPSSLNMLSLSVFLGVNSSWC